jgi:beta-lysine 5,6-aminomutase beta subunit
MNPDFSRILPYGDTLDDGKVQVSFTIPMPMSDEAREAARQLAGNMNLEDVGVVHSRDLTQGFSFHVLYGRLARPVDATRITVPKVSTPVMTYYEVNDFIASRFDRPIRVVGACTGSDAHTVGLDAIMNMKGYAGEYGLERYKGFETWNMGSQVQNEDLIELAVKVDADAILVSQVVTQKDIHIKNLTNLVELLEAENLRERFLLVVGGPRVSHELALELGFDAGFGPGTLPPDVASYIAQTLAGDAGGSDEA